MANTELRTRILIRNDVAANWTSVNPKLSKGEMGIEIDTNLIKIGDGVTAWNDLEYIGGKEGGNGGVFNANTHYDFPSIGSVDMIYKAEDERKIYQWNPDLLKYEVLSEIEITIQDLEIIHGGNANVTA